jgi:O-antigen/teichoic acid export membrane protein
LWSAEGVVIVAAVIETVVLARVLGPTKFGGAALVMSVPTLIFTFFDPRSAEAVVKYTSEFLATDRMAQASAVVRVGLCGDAILGALGVLCTAGVASWSEHHIVHSGGTTWLIIGFAFAQAFAAPANTSRAVLTVAGKFSTIAALQTAKATAAAVLTISLVASGRGIDGVVIGNGLAIVADGLIATAIASSVLKRQTNTWWLTARVRVLGAQLREVVRFIVFTDLTGLASLFVKQADLTFVGYFGTSRDAGLYQLARTIASPLGNNLVSPLQSVAYPRFATLAATQPTSAVVARGRRYLLVAGVPLGAIVLLFLTVVPSMTRLAGGNQFSDAAGPAVILLAGSALTLMFFWVRPMILALGEVGSLLVVGVVGFAMSIIGYPIAARWAGGAGVATVRSVVTIVGNVGGLWYALRRLERREHASASAGDGAG